MWVSIANRKLVREKEPFIYDTLGYKSTLNKL